MKKILIAILMIILLSSCGQKSTEVPLIIYDMKDNYMEDFVSRIVDNSRGLFSIQTYDSQNSQVIQNEFIEKLIEDAPLLIINPVDRLGAYIIIEKAAKTNTPIIFINREPLSSDLLLGKNVYYIGANPIESAILQAEIVMDLFGGNPVDLNEMDRNNDNVIQAVILKGQIGHQDAELRTEYVIKEIEQNGYSLEVLEIKVANFDMETAETAMLILLEEYGDSIEVVIANNDAMAIGAINTLINQEYFIDTNQNGSIERDTETWLPVIGIDGLDASIELIDSGYLYGTVINDSESMAKAIIALANAILNGDDINSIDYEIVDGIYIWIEYKKQVKEE